MAIRRLFFLLCILLLLLPFTTVSAAPVPQQSPCDVTRIAEDYLPRLLASQDMDEFMRTSQELVDVMSACPPEELLNSAIQAFSDFLNVMMNGGIPPVMSDDPISMAQPDEIITPEAYAGVPIGGKYAGIRNIQRASDVADNVSRGVTEDGIPYIGDPDAPITIAEFFDFTCPHCADYLPTLTDLIMAFARTGYTKIELYPLPSTYRDPGASDSARMALCAARQGAFWEMHDAIYALYDSGAPDFSFENMLAQAENIGLDGNLMTACMFPYSPNPALELAQAYSLEIGLTGTPTIVYRFIGDDTWSTIPDTSGGISGGRDFQVLHDLIIEANTSI